MIERGYMGLTLWVTPFTEAPTMFELLLQWNVANEPVSLMPNWPMLKSMRVVGFQPDQQNICSANLTKGSLRNQIFWITGRFLKSTQSLCYFPVLSVDVLLYIFW